MIWFWMTAIVAALVSLAFIAIRLPYFAKVLVLAQVVYWSISFVARPAILAIVRPAPYHGDGLADARLAQDGYTTSLAHVLELIAFGLWVYVLVVLAVSPLIRRLGAPLEPHSGWAPLDVHGRTVVLLLYGLGWAARLVGESSGEASGVVALGQAVGASAAVALLIFWPSQRRTRTWLVLGAVVALELGWSVLFASKTPILAAALALAIRAGAAQRGRQLLVKVVVIGFAAIAAFSLVQGVKVAIDAPTSSDETAARYPALLAPTIDIIERFDVMRAVTDAHFAGPNTWWSPLGYAEAMVTALVPEQVLGEAKQPVGLLWAQQVRNQSITDANVDVHLATGFVGPGWVIGGYWGIVFEAVFLALVLTLVQALLVRAGLVARLVGALLIAYPALFERSALGVMEIVSRGIQVALVVLLVSLIVPRRQGSRAVGRGTSPRAPSVSSRRRESVSSRGRGGRGERV